MARYHINPKTMAPGVCKAKTPENCRFKEDNGDSTPHYNTPKEAAEAAEKKLEEVYKSVETFKAESNNPLSSGTVERTITKKVAKTANLAEQLGVVSEKTLNSMIKRRLRNGLTLKETEVLINKHGYSNVPFNVYYNKDQEITLDYDDYETQRTFSKGACGALASELNRVTGLPLVLFTKDEKSISWQGHAAVRLPDGTHFDIGGVGTREDLNREFSDAYEWTEKVVSREKFNETMSIENDSAVAHLDKLEKASLAKICFDLINDYQLNNPEKAGTMKDSGE